MIDHGVAAQHQEGVVEESGVPLDVAQRAGGTEWLTDEFAVGEVALEGIGDLHPETASVAEVLFDRMGVVAGVDHDLGYPVMPQAIDQ